MQILKAKGYEVFFQRYSRKKTNVVSLTAHGLFTERVSGAHNYRGDDDTILLYAKDSSTDQLASALVFILQKVTSTGIFALSATSPAHERKGLSVLLRALAILIARENGIKHMTSEAISLASQKLLESKFRFHLIDDSQFILHNNGLIENISNSKSRRSKLLHQYHTAPRYFTYVSPTLDESYISDYVEPIIKRFTGTSNTSNASLAKPKLPSKSKFPAKKSIPYHTPLSRNEFNKMIQKSRQSTRSTITRSVARRSVV